MKDTFGDLSDSFDFSAVDRDIDQGRGSGDVPIPNVVMDELVIPDHFAGTGVEADEAIGEEIVACASAAVEIAGGHFDGEINEAEFLIAAERRPGARVAGVFPRIVIPRFVASFAVLRDGVERPEFFSCADVEAANVAGDVGLRGWRGAREQGGTHNDGVFHDYGRGTGPDVSRFDDGAIKALRQVDQAIRTEAGNRVAGFGIECDELVAGRN